MDASRISEFQRKFDSVFEGGGRQYLASAPGRVNLIGDHTDYKDGLVMPLAIDRVWAFKTTLSRLYEEKTGGAPVIRVISPADGAQIRQIR